MKTNYLLILMATAFISLNALHGQENPENIAGKFFQKLDQSGSLEAVNYIYSTNPYIMDDTARINKTRNEFKAMEKSRGKYCGYELISKEETSASFIKYSYLIKYEKAPLVAEIYFYMPKQLWQVVFVELNNPVKNERERSQGMKQQGTKQQGSFNKNTNSGTKSKNTKQNPNR